MMDYTPEIVQVVPHEDYTVSVYFCDGKIVTYDARPKLDQGVFQALKDKSFFINNCKIMNDTLVMIKNMLIFDGKPSLGN